MSPESLIPAVDGAGLPAPVWLFHLLLVFTFFLHMVFMNLTLGGTWLAAIAHALSGGQSSDPRGVLARRMMAVNSYGISLTITTGVAPLLFIQLLYQQFFYAATILIGGMWFAFLILLILGYYSAYLYKFRGAPARGTGGGVWLWSSALLFSVIGATHVAAHLVHAQPGSWVAIAANPWIVLADPTFVPRLLHYLLAGIAFSGLVMAWWAVRQLGRGVEPELNRSIASFGWKWALWTTVAQVVDGFLLLILLPQEVLIGLMRGGAATLVPLTIAILLAVGLLVMMARTMDPADHPALLTGVLGAMTAVIAVMSITRHQIRALYLDPYVDLSAFAVRSQWVNFVIFALLLVVTLVVVAWMVRRVLTSPATGDGAA